MTLSHLPASEHTRVQKKIFAEMEKWLDRTTGIDCLTRSGVPEMVIDAIQYRVRAGIWSAPVYVVMPSHVHFLIEVLQKCLKESLESFKQRTGQEAARILGRRGFRFWQTEWFDHWVRSRDEEVSITEYIKQNPVKAKLVGDYRDWPDGSWNIVK